MRYLAEIFIAFYAALCARGLIHSVVRWDHMRNGDRIFLTLFSAFGIAVVFVYFWRN